MHLLWANWKTYIITACTAYPTDLKASEKERPCLLRLTPCILSTSWSGYRSTSNQCISSQSIASCCNKKTTAQQSILAELYGFILQHKPTAEQIMECRASTNSCPHPSRFRHRVVLRHHTSFLRTINARLSLEMPTSQTLVLDFISDSSSASNGGFHCIRPSDSPR